MTGEMADQRKEIKTTLSLSLSHSNSPALVVARKSRPASENIASLLPFLTPPSTTNSPPNSHPTCPKAERWVFTGIARSYPRPAFIRAIPSQWGPLTIGKLRLAPSSYKQCRSMPREDGMYSKVFCILPLLQICRGVKLEWRASPYS